MAGITPWTKYRSRHSLCNCVPSVPEVLLGLRDPWKWDQQFVPKHWNGITTVCCIKSLKSADLNEWNWVGSGCNNEIKICHPAEIKTSYLQNIRTVFWLTFTFALSWNSSVWWQGVWCSLPFKFAVRPGPHIFNILLLMFSFYTASFISYASQ